MSHLLINQTQYTDAQNIRQYIENDCVRDNYDIIKPSKYIHVLYVYCVDRYGVYETACHMWNQRINKQQEQF